MRKTIAALTLLTLACLGFLHGIFELLYWDLI